jgi:hypothetical protein
MNQTKMAYANAMTMLLGVYPTEYLAATLQRLGFSELKWHREWRDSHLVVNESKTATQWIHTLNLSPPPDLQLR